MGNRIEAMAAVDIPDDQIEGIKRLLSADLNTFESMLANINRIAPAATFDVIDERIHAAGDESGTNVQDAFDTLAWIFYRRQQYLDRFASASDFIESLCASLTDKWAGEIPSENLARFKGALSDLLNARTALGLSLRANDLVTEHERNFMGIRIVTDVRPLFPEEGKLDPVAAVVTHSLRIRYYENGSNRDFYVGLDAGELKEIRRAVERAEDKANSTKEFLKRSGMPYIEANDAESPK